MECARGGEFGAFAGGPVGVGPHFGHPTPAAVYGAGGAVNFQDGPNRGRGMAVASVFQEID